MSQVFNEGRLSFRFPDDWVICRPGAASYYSRHFQSFCGGCKETDFLAYEPSRRTLWCIEVKDYRVFSRTRTDGLADEVALKTRDVFAMLPIGGVRDNASSQDGRVEIGDFWNSAREAANLRVVLHCELPTRPSRLFAGVKDAANLEHQLRQKLRCVDPHALLTSKTDSRMIPWAVVDARFSAS